MPAFVPFLLENTNWAKLVHIALSQLKQNQNIKKNNSETTIFLQNQLLH